MELHKPKLLSSKQDLYTEKGIFLVRIRAAVRDACSFYSVLLRMCTFIASVYNAM